MEKKTAAKIVSLMFGAFGAANDSQRIAIYANMLSSIPLNLLEAGCNKCMLECRFIPTIAEVREACRSLYGETNKLGEVTWSEAWQQIEQAMYSTPWGKKPVFKSAAVEQTVEAFGWSTLQSSKTDDMPIIRAQVKKIFESVCKQRKETALNGFILGSNNPKGILGISPILEASLIAQKGFQEAVEAKQKNTLTIVKHD